MAKKKNIITAEPAPNQDGAEDLTILSPDRDITIQGKKITVREYRFNEGMRVRLIGKPLIDDLYAVMQSANLSIDNYLDVLSQHQALVTELIAMSCGLSVDEIASLSGVAGIDLVEMWWLVNGPFFTRAVIKRIARERITAELQRTAGATPSNNSSATATATTASPATPNDK